MQPMVSTQITAARGGGAARRACGQLMKIAYFVNQYPGISHSFIRREIQAMERRGVHVRRYAVRPSRDKIIAREDEEESAKTRHIATAPKLALLRAMAARIASTPLRAAGALGTALAMGWRSEAGLARHVFYFCEALVLADWLKRDGVFHIHAHFGTNSTSVAMLAARLTGGTYSFTAHGPEEFEKPALISLPKKIENAAFAVGVSQYGASQLKKLSSSAAWPRIKIIRCGLEKDFYVDSESDPPAAPRFVCVGRLCAEKGQLDLIAAAARVARERPDLRIALIGDGPMRVAVEAAIARHALEGQIELCGWKTPAEVRAAILAARAFILPSYAEGLPVSLMEALALRRPVISTFVAGIPELVADGACGWLTPAGDIDAVADAMRAAIAAPPGAIAAMGDEGRRRVTAMHDVDKEAEKLAGYFAEVLETAP